MDLDEAIKLLCGVQDGVKKWNRRREEAAHPQVIHVTSSHRVDRSSSLAKSNPTCFPRLASPHG